METLGPRVSVLGCVPLGWAIRENFSPEFEVEGRWWPLCHRSVALSSSYSNTNEANSTHRGPPAQLFLCLSNSWAMCVELPEEGASPGYPHPQDQRPREQTWVSVCPCKAPTLPCGYWSPPHLPSQWPAGGLGAPATSERGQPGAGRLANTLL